MVDKRQVELVLGVRTQGAKDAAAEVQKISREALSLDTALAKIGRADEITQLATKWGLVAKRTKDATTAAAELNAELKKINASEAEIQGAAGTFSSAQSGGSNRLARVGQELRALPSQQIPGLGIGTDAIGNFARLGGALSEAAGKTTFITNTTKAFVPVLGQTGAAIAATTAAALPFAAAIAGIALAVDFFTKQTSQNADAIKAYAEGQRDLNQKIATGYTTEQAQEDLRILKEMREGEKKLLDENKAAYADFERQARQATGAGTGVGEAVKAATTALGGFAGATVDAGDVAINAAKAFSGDEQSLADNIATSEGNVLKFDESIQNIERSLANGTLAANDMRVKEEELAKARSEAALTSADSAAKELQAEQRALAASEQQNKDRLAAIENESAVIEKQLEVLSQSGDTSEAVTDKIAALKEQLGLLGDESSFITETALEASRARDAEKKAAEDQKKAQEEAARAAETHAKAVQSATTQYQQSVQDIGTRFSQTLQDNQTKFDRDLIGLTTKYRRDEYDLELKSYRAERDAMQDQLNDLASIREAARKDEQQALQEGDFKQLYLSRVARDEALQQEAKTDEMERQKREQSQQDAREDLLRSLDRQRFDRREGYRYQEMDAQTARNRELAQARLTQQRALQAASTALNAELGIRQQFWNTTLQQAQNALNQIQGAGAAGGANALRGNQANMNAFSFGGLKRVIRR